MHFIFIAVARPTSHERTANNQVRENMLFWETGLFKHFKWPSNSGYRSYRCYSTKTEKIFSNRRALFTSNFPALQIFYLLFGILTKKTARKSVHNEILWNGSSWYCPYFEEKVLFLLLFSIYHDILKIYSTEFETRYWSRSRIEADYNVVCVFF